MVSDASRVADGPKELGAFLRARRAGLNPETAGLDATGNPPPRPNHTSRT
jgi:hypothetical protein